MRQGTESSVPLAFGVEPSTHTYRVRSTKYVEIAARIQRELHARGHVDLLDIACGNGKLMMYAAAEHVHAVGVDLFISSSADDALSRGYRQVLTADVRSPLPFKDESFDVVVCSHILEHLLEPDRLVEEAWRVLRPGGLLVVGVPMHTAVTRWLRVHVVPLLKPRKRRERMIAEFGHVQFFTMHSLTRLLRRFAIEDTRGFHFMSTLLPVENFRWWFEVNSWFGRTFPSFTGEVNVAARKPSGHWVRCTHAHERI